MTKVLTCIIGIAGLLLCGCAAGKPPQTLEAERIARINAEYYAEHLEDDEPCCAPLDEWMPKLFEPARPRARLPEAAFYP